MTDFHNERLSALGLQRPSYTKSRALQKNGNAVVEVTPGEFASALNTHADKVVLVNYYAPWCGYCTQLAPKYEAAARTLSNNNHKDIVLIKVDATDPQFGAQHDIEGFPTLRVFKKGKMVGDYPGERSAEAITRFMYQQTAASK